MVTIVGGVQIIHLSISRIAKFCRSLIVDMVFESISERKNRYDSKKNLVTVFEELGAKFQEDAAFGQQYFKSPTYRGIRLLMSTLQTRRDFAIGCIPLRMPEICC